MQIYPPKLFKKVHNLYHCKKFMHIRCQKSASDPHPTFQWKKIFLPEPRDGKCTEWIENLNLGTS